VENDVITITKNEFDHVFKKLYENLQKETPNNNYYSSQKTQNKS